VQVLLDHNQDIEARLNDKESRRLRSLNDLRLQLALFKHTLD